MELLTKTYAVEHLGLDPSVFDRPVKVVQFGTGVLLRGLIDYIFQKAGDLGLFNGRIAMVRSTSNDVSEFLAQDGLYTVVETGLNEREETIIHSTLVHCVNPVWSAADNRQDLLHLFASPDLKLIVSNTTEMGLVYIEEQILNEVPQSFPANLTSLLHHRFQALGGRLESGLTIIPTELLIDNGRLLKRIIKQHAEYHQLSAAFIQWLDDACDFCDSLVDRIVPGKLKHEVKGMELPYADHLAIQTEPYFLWAIQSNTASNDILPFSGHLPGLVITKDLQPYREQKLKLLNGGHTILSPLAWLLGCRTVEQMMKNEYINLFLSKVCETEILPTLEDLAPDAEGFYRQMKARWLNPFMDHALRSILAQSTTKMLVRNGDSFIRYFNTNGELPRFLSFGFAAYLYLFRPQYIRRGQYIALDLQGNEFEVNDAKAEYLYRHWMPFFKGEMPMDEIIPSLLEDKLLFDHKCITLPGFIEKISGLLRSFQESGLLPSLLTLLNPVPQHV